MNLKTIIKKTIRRINILYALELERRVFLNWFNPFATLYFNLRLLPLKQAIRFPIFVYGWPRILSLYGSVEIEKKDLKMGMVKINRSWHVAGAPNNMGVAEEFNIWGTILFHGDCLIGTGGKITVGENGILEIGADCKIMSQCNITAYKIVEIGDHFLMAHSSQIFDTSYHYVADFNKRRVKQIGTPVRIGNNCWLCNSVTIMGPTNIPNYTIVASHSLVNKDFSEIPEESIVGGMPARLIATGYRKIDNSEMQKMIDKYFLEHPGSTVFLLEEDVNHNLF